MIEFFSRPDWLLILFEKVALLFFILMIFLGIKGIKDLEELDEKEIWQEVFFCTFVFVLYLLLGGWVKVSLKIWFIVAFFSVLIGFFSGFAVKIKKEEETFYTLGTNFYLLVWSLQIVITELINNRGEGFSYIFMLTAAGTLFLLWGASFNLVYRKKKLNRLIKT